MAATPNTRIEGFEGDWVEKQLGELLSFQNGFNGAKEAYGTGIPLISVMDILDDYFITFNSIRGKAEVAESERERFSVKNGDILFQRSSENVEDAGRSNVFLDSDDKPAIFGGFVIRGRNIADFNPVFMKYLLDSKPVRAQFVKKAQGAQHVNVSQEVLQEIKIKSPDIKEQEMIGLIFEKIDALTALHQKKCGTLAQLNVYFLQKMFPRDGERVPEIRFEGFTDPWEQRKLSEVADKVTEKNKNLAVQETFTNSAEFGVISQRDFFDHDISNIENIGGYYVVRNQDFVYNPRISVTAPVGPVNRNKLGRNGVMSPLYTVFRTHDIDTSYLEWFFKSSFWHPFMLFNGDSGVRSDRFSIKDAVFFEMPIPTPSFNEQRQIGAYLDHNFHGI